MADSTVTARKRKPKTPDKPYADFPLFAHQSGRWAKKVCRKIRFYGRWGTMKAGKIIPIEDVPDSARKALEEFNRCWPYHSKDQDAPGKDDGDHKTMSDLANSFLENKFSRVESRELSAHSFGDYHRICALLISHFGGARRIDTLKPADFEELRRKIAKGRSLTTLNNKVNLVRVVFKYAFESRLIDRPMHFGQSFDRPPKMRLREARNEAGPNIFTREELITLIDACKQVPRKVSTASSAMHAMILLGLNAGFGNTDVSNLPQSAVDLRTGWIEFPRPKTAIKRRVPLWPETVEALRTAIAERPPAKSADDDGMCFLTENGTRFVRVQPSKKHEDQFVVINGVLRQFDKLLSALTVGQRPRIGFYTLRHVFETIAGGSKDQVAVDAIMGHADQTMASAYRETIDDSRLKSVTDHVREWLWPKAKPMNEQKSTATRKVKTK